MTEQDLNNAFGDGTGVKSKKTEKNPEEKEFRLQSGDNFFRILPPVFSNVSRNIWAQFYNRHWLATAQGGRFPVLCTQTYDQKNKKFNDDCVFCKNQAEAKTLFNKAKRNLETLEEQLKEQGDKLSEADKARLDDDIEAAREAVALAGNSYQKPDGKFFINAMSEDGKISYLGLPKTLYEILVGKKNEETGYREGGLINELLEKQGLDSISPNGGVLFNFRREGSGQFNTEYKAVPVTEVTTTEVNGVKRKVEYLKEFPLSHEQKLEVLKKARDLKLLFDNIRFSKEEQQQIVNSNNDLEVIMDLIKSKRPVTVTEAAATTDSEVPF